MRRNWIYFRPTGRIGRSGSTIICTRLFEQLANNLGPLGTSLFSFRLFQIFKLRGMLSHKSESCFSLS